MINNSVNITSNAGITSISKSSYGTKNIGCYFRFYNSGSEKLSDISIIIYFEKADGTKITDFSSGTLTIYAGGYLPSSTTVYYNAASSSSTTLISNLSNGSYNLVFEVVGGAKDKVSIFITD